MLAKFSIETKVCNLLRSYLIANDYNILQLVCPGAQATYSITFNNIRKKRTTTVFPDLIALKDGTILIGEIKAGFSIPDKLKLLDFRESSNAEMNIKSLVARITRTQTADNKIQYLLIHGNINCLADSEIMQLAIIEGYSVLL